MHFVLCAPVMLYRMWWSRSCRFLGGYDIVSALCARSTRKYARKPRGDVRGDCGNGKANTKSAAISDVISDKRMPFTVRYVAVGVSCPPEGFYYFLKPCCLR